MALQKEIWINQIKQNFYPDSSFLNFVRDFSALVEFDAINIAEAGVDPDVLINNNTYPIAVKQRVDKNQRNVLSWTSLKQKIRLCAVLKLSSTVMTNSKACLWDIAVPLEHQRQRKLHTPLHH